MEPSIGRIVWFKTRQGTISPAIVTRVWSERHVSLHVFEDHQPAYSEDKVEFDGTRTTPRTWAWPPPRS